MVPWKPVTQFALIPESQKDDWQGNYGQGVVKIQHNYESNTFWILGYTYTRSQWEIFQSASAQKYTCIDRINAAKFVYNSKDYKNYSNHTNKVDNFSWNDKYKYTEYYEFIRDTGSIRNLMTYWAIANCKPSCVTNNSTSKYCMGPLNVSLEMHFTNAASGINREFSYEEIGLLPVTIVYFGVQALLFVYALVVRFRLVNKHRKQLTFDLLLAVVSITFFKYLMSLIYWGKYSLEGKASSSLWTFTCIVEVVHTTLFIVLFIALGSGWTVFRRKLPVLNRLRIVAFASFYLVFSLASVSWISSESYVGRVNYTEYFESTPGILMLVLLSFAGIRYHILMSRYVCL